MSFTGANLYTQGFGSRPENVEVPVLSQVSPGVGDINYPIGKRWINEALNAEFTLTSLSSANGITTAFWEVSAGGSLLISTVTTEDSTVVVPTGGNVNLLGSGSTTTVGSGSTATVELTGLTDHAVLVGAGTTTITKLAVGATGTVLAGATGADPAFTGSPSLSGTVTAGTGFTATTGDITATTGNLVATAGSLHLNGVTSRILINAAAPLTNAVGSFTLSGSATTTLTSSAITASSLMFFSLKTLGTVSTSAITYTTSAGSATITPASSTDTSTYTYLIIN